VEPVTWLGRAGDRIPLIGPLAMKGPVTTNKKGSPSVLSASAWSSVNVTSQEVRPVR
jgi:hypothetical protein